LLFHHWRQFCIGTLSASLSQRGACGVRTQCMAYYVGIPRMRSATYNHIKLMEFPVLCARCFAVAALVFSSLGVRSTH